MYVVHCPHWKCVRRVLSSTYFILSTLSRLSLFLSLSVPSPSIPLSLSCSLPISLSPISRLLPLSISPVPVFTYHTLCVYFCFSGQFDEFYKISYMWSAPLAIVSCVVPGLILSLATRMSSLTNMNQDRIR